MQVGDSQCADPKIAQAVADVLKDCLGKVQSALQFCLWLQFLIFPLVPQVSFFCVKIADLGRDAICATTCCIVLQRLLASRACFDATKSLSDVLAVLFQVTCSSQVSL